MNFLKAKQKKISQEDSEGEQADCDELVDPKEFNFDMEEATQKMKNFDLGKLAQFNVRKMTEIKRSDK